MEGLREYCCDCSCVNAESAEDELKVHLSNFMGVTMKGSTYNMTSLSTKSVLSSLQREFKLNGKKDYFYHTEYFNNSIQQ